MERILTCEQMRSAEENTINNLSISSQTLIERAGTAIANEIVKRFHGGRVLVCVGKGNNGQDGKIVASLLKRVHGFTVATLNADNGMFKLLDKEYDIIIDCLFGTGLNREIEGKYRLAVEKINQSNAYVISCDIPSGINANTGKVMGVAVKANLTVAIQEYKFGHFLSDGKDYCGELVCKDIGISIWGEDYVKKLTNSDVSHLFDIPNKTINKGNLKKACVIGGSKNFPGGVLLSINALLAYKCGLGYCNLAIPKSLLSVYGVYAPECTYTCLDDNDGLIIFDKEKLDGLLKFDCISIGMGLGVSKEVYDTICYLLKNYTGKLIIDADGLNALSEYGVEVLNEKACKVIITPHIGEFSRLTKKDKGLISNNPLKYANDFALKHEVVVVLKNATTIITDGKETVFNTTGNQGMAKGGSGDVLSGFMTGIVAKNDNLLLACAGSCYLFGLAGDLAVKEQNVFCVTPSDIVRFIPDAINKIID